MLQYSSTEEDGETQADGSYVFQITTPLITYTIKAPHKVRRIRHVVVSLSGRSLTAALASRWFAQVAAEEWITAIEKAKQCKRKSGKKGGTFALTNHFGPRPRDSHARVVGCVSHRSPERGGRHETVASVLAGGGRARRRRYATPLHLIFLILLSFFILFWFNCFNCFNCFCFLGCLPRSPPRFSAPGINPRFEGAFLTYMLPDARKEKVLRRLFFPPLPLSAADQLMTLARPSASNTEDADLVHEWPRCIKSRRTR